MKPLRNGSVAASILALTTFFAALEVRGGDGVPGASKGKTAKLPFIIFTEKGSATNHYVPSGWMGNIKAIRVEEGCETRPHSGATCLRLEYRAPG